MKKKEFVSRAIEDISFLPFEAGQRKTGLSLLEK
jgi:hypothetical protein